ncbi:MAG: NUDIX hydrolase [Candidatus Omnitrophica bacterium]|nr:NUDIX hydrolase [Candidatus Omnitrophota bacterium]
MAKEKSIYNGRLFHLVTRRARLPHGRKVQLEIVRHPGAALIVPFLAKDSVIILRQLRPVISKYLYELPAGTIDKGESALSCARREVIEETGYAAKKFTRLGMIYPVPGYSTEKISIYKAEHLIKRQKDLDDDEVLVTKVVTRSLIRRLFKTGKIIDAKTICAFALCGWL